MAQRLLAEALVGASGPVSIDVPDRQSDFLDVLQGAGFEPVRPFTRMMRGRPRRPAIWRPAIAIVGPEFG